MATGVIHHLCHFGFCNLMGKHANNGDAFLVNRQHDVKRLGAGQAKEPFQQRDNKFHRREIIIQQQYFIQRRALGLWPRIGHYPDVATGVVILVRHGDLSRGQFGRLRAGWRLVTEVYRRKCSGEKGSLRIG